MNCLYVRHPMWFSRFVCALVLNTLFHANWIYASSIVEIDLASESGWELKIDDQEALRPIKVPYGGWNSDRQATRLSEDTDVKDHVIYSRQIQIPAEAAGRVTKLVFGAVNYGADILIDGQLVGAHVGPFTSFEVDLTEHVVAGGTYTLQVKAYTLNHYNRKNQDLVAQGKMTIKQALEQGDIYVPTGFVYFSRNSTLGYGICRSVKLLVFPALYVKDVFVCPSVSNQSLSYNVCIENRSDQERTISLKSALASWNADSWNYPQIADVVVTLAAGQSKKVIVGPIPWNLGQESYWWPNIPFREDYPAKLHYLNLTVDEAGNVRDTYQQRFGFVEHSEGTYYYTVNGVRLNLPSDATAITQGGVYDGYAEAAAFKPPTGPNTGCTETWKRYMRMGIRANRTHQELPTEYMMQAADEVGFILIPESAIRGSYLPQSYDPNEPSYASHLREMVEQCRNHPSVARYSLSNEMGAISQFIGFAAPYDPTRPLVFESNSHNNSTRIETSKGHAYTIAHYCAWPQPAHQIFGMGEYAWSTDGMADYATQGKNMRLNDICYFSGWSWLNYWPNFLEGYNYATHAWKQNRHADRVDGVDGWVSPIVKYVQTSLHPYLIMDHEIERIALYTADWPGISPTIKPGSPITRSIEIFNDALFGNQLTFNWSAHWDSPDGQVIASGSNDLQIEPGFHVTENVDFNVPDIGTAQERYMYLVLESAKNGQVVFREERISFRVSVESPLADAQFLGEDAITSGTWMGKYGREGYDIAGAQMELPGYATLSWQDDGVYIWQKDIQDERALQYFLNDGNQGFSRIAAKHSRFGTVHLTVDVGESYHQVGLYFLDWENRGQPQTIVVPEAGIEQTVENYQGGKFLLFKVRGKITFAIEGVGISEISGVFFDPFEGQPVVENKTRIDDRDTSIQYSGQWYTWEGNGGYMNTETYSSTAGAEASLTFNGNKVRWYGFKRWDMGMAEVYLDGQLKATVDCYDPAMQLAILFDSENLSIGQHTIKIRVKGENNAGSSGTYVIIDAFDYFADKSVKHLWKFNETSGANAADSAGNCTGTVHGGATWQPSGGKIKGAISLNGINGYVSVPAMNLNSNSVTITAWVKRNGVQPAYTGIVFTRAGSSIAGLDFGPDGKELRYCWNNANWDWPSGIAIPDNTWVLVAIVLEPAKATLYMHDGTLHSAIHNVSHGIEEFDSVTCIGQDSQGGRFLNGKIDDVRIYNASLTYDDIESLYARLKGDFNDDGTINFIDLGMFAGNWLQENELQQYDLNGDGRVDFKDFAMLAENW